MPALGLFEIANTRAHLLRGAEPKVIACNASEDGDTGKRRSVVFIHGAGYASKEEVIRDLIAPFCKATDLRKSLLAHDLAIKFVYWQSSPSWEGTWGQAYRQALGCFQRFKDLELKSFHSSVQVLDELRMLLSKASSPPIFISHSLGAMVMVHMLRQLFVRGISLPTGSCWWSLQPAIEQRAYCKGSKFHFIPAMFATVGGRHVVSFSRQDIVLRTIYRLFKGKTSMGLMGPVVASVEANDLTETGKEAHGTFSWSKIGGNFFERTHQLLANKMRELLYVSQTGES